MQHILQAFAAGKSRTARLVTEILSVLITIPSTIQQVEDQRQRVEQMDMLMNVCLQAYQRFGQTLGKQQLEKSTSFRLSKMTSMRSMRELFDDAAERGISRANTMSPTESTRPLASRRKEADIIQTTDKSMDDLLGASARIAGLQSANRKQNTDMDAADDLAQKKQRNQSKRFFA